MPEVKNKYIPQILKQLVAEGKLSPKHAEKAYYDAKERGKSISTHLVQKQIASEMDVALYNSFE